MRFAETPTFFGIFVCFELVFVRAIIIHPDVSDSKYVTNISTVPFFVSLDNRGSCAGTLVAGSADAKFSYVLSAAHCFCSINGRKSNRPTAVIFYDDSKVFIWSCRDPSFAALARYQIFVLSADIITDKLSRRSTLRAAIYCLTQIANFRAEKMAPINVISRSWNFRPMKFHQALWRQR